MDKTRPGYRLTGPHPRLRLSSSFRHSSSYSSDIGLLKSIRTISTSKATSTQHSRLTCCRSGLPSSASQLSLLWDYSSEEDEPLNPYWSVAIYNRAKASLEQRAHQQLAHPRTSLRFTLHSRPNSASLYQVPAQPPTSRIRTGSQFCREPTSRQVQGSRLARQGFQFWRGLNQDSRL